MRRLAAVLLLLLCLSALSAETGDSQAPLPTRPSLTWSLVPDDALQGSRRAWAIGCTGAAVGAGLGWSIYEAWGMLHPFLKILDSSDLSRAGEAGGRILADADFQGHLFGFAFGLVATGLAANILDHIVHEVEAAL